MSDQVKLTASVLQTLQERLDQRGLESSSDQNLTVGGHLMTMAMQMSKLILSHIMIYYREYYRLNPQPILDPSNLLLLPNTQ